MTLDPIAKVLFLVGVGFIIASVAWQFGWIQSLKLGHLPGDIYIEKENSRFYFPITTGILVSVIVSLINWLWSKWR